MLDILGLRSSNSDVGEAELLVGTIHSLLRAFATVQKLPSGLSLLGSKIGRSF